MSTQPEQKRNRVPAAGGKRPLYRSVTDALRRQLVKGTLSAGAKLPSLRELATEFNVSTITVSQALRLLEREGHLTCIPAVGAFVRSANTGRNTVKQITVAYATIEIESVFTARIASAIEEACQQRGWALQIYNAQTNPHIEAHNLARMSNSDVSGAIVLPVADGDNLEAMFRLKLSDFPFVVVDRAIPGLKVDVVESDHEQGAYIATQHLIEQGHTRIYILTAPVGMLSSADARLLGYERALIEHGIEPLRERRIILFDPKNGEENKPTPEFPWTKWYETVLPVLRKIESPVAFFAMNYYAGRGILEACRELHLRIPEDISIVSFDDSDSLQAFSPPITAVAQRTREIGRMAVELLERRIQNPEGGQPQHVKIDVDLMKRQSVLNMK